MSLNCDNTFMHHFILTSLKDMAGWAQEKASGNTNCLLYTPSEKEK